MKPKLHKTYTLRLKLHMNMRTEGLLIQEVLLNGEPTGVERVVKTPKSKHGVWGLGKVTWYVKTKKFPTFENAIAAAVRTAAKETK